MSIWTFHKWLPCTDEKFRFTRAEGGTPLLRSVNIAKKVGVSHLYFKLENLNPTGSYKDRFAAMTVSRMLQKGQKRCITTSSGNTGAALAAYCAAAKIECIVIAVDGAPEDKLLQMQVYGARVLEVELFGKDAKTTDAIFSLLKNNAMENQELLPISAYCYCPEGMRGVESIAFEIMDTLHAEYIFCPAGGGGLTLAVAQGSETYCRQHTNAHRPQIHCVQPVGNDTISTGLNTGSSKARKLEKSTTKISGLQVPTILDGNEVIEACTNSMGKGHLVEDEEIFYWQTELARQEGIFSEAAGAVALAGLHKAVKSKTIDPDGRMVCLITGSGFKNIAQAKEKFLMEDVQKTSVSHLQDLLYTR